MILDADSVFQFSVVMWTYPNGRNTLWDVDPWPGRGGVRSNKMSNIQYTKMLVSVESSGKVLRHCSHRLVMELQWDQLWVEERDIAAYKEVVSLPYFIGHNAEKQDGSYIQVLLGICSTTLMRFREMDA